jgi:hypothetical protein
VITWNLQFWFNISVKLLQSTQSGVKTEPLSPRSTWPAVLCRDMNGLTCEPNVKTGRTSDWRCVKWLLWGCWKSDWNFWFVVWRSRTGNRLCWLRFFVVSSVHAGKRRDSTLDYDTNVSFHTLSNSSFKYLSPFHSTLHSLCSCEASLNKLQISN